MKYNTAINNLRNWVQNRSLKYYEKYNEERAKYGPTVSYVRYQVMWEISLKLGSLVEQEYDDFNQFVQAVKDLMKLHYDFILYKNMTNERKSILMKQKMHFYNI